MIANKPHFRPSIEMCYRMSFTQWLIIGKIKFHPITVIRHFVGWIWKILWPWGHLIAWFLPLEEISCVSIQAPTIRYAYRWHSRYDTSMYRWIVTPLTLIMLIPILHPARLVTHHSTIAYTTLCTVLDSPISSGHAFPCNTTFILGLGGVTCPYTTTQSFQKTWEFGFSLGYTLGHTPVSSPMNHSSALCYPSHVNHYIATESHAHALCGPFPYPPFEPSFQINPLMTAPKKHSEMRRVILDLSHPEGASVNYGIPRDTYLGVPYKLHLPSAQDLRGLIVSQGQGCHLWSVDFQRGYRQLRVCPMDWPLLGIAWNGAFYFDMAVPFGIRWGAMYMQRTTSAVTRLAGHEAIPCIAYIDDVASAQSPGDAIRGKRRFQSLLVELGLQENISKGSEPSTRMTWLGVDFDSEAMTMSVPTIKINECLRMARSWATKEYCMKSQLRKFLGKLFHICQCCPTLRLLYPPKRSFGGVYWIHPVRPSVCLSVRPSVRPSVGRCPDDNSNSFQWI